MCGQGSFDALPHRLVKDAAVGAVVVANGLAGLAQKGHGLFDGHFIPLAAAMAADLASASVAS